MAIKIAKVVALSTTEAEYIAEVETRKEWIWMKSFLSKQGMKLETFLLHCDNQSAIHLATNICLPLRYH